MQLIQRNGDLRLYVSDGQYVMDGGTTGKHSLCVDVSSLERVQAHWKGFQESNVELGGCRTDVVLSVESLSPIEAPKPVRELTPLQKIKESVRSEREKARREAKSCWAFVMSRGVQFFARHPTNHNLDLGNSNENVNVTKKELLENIEAVCNEHKDIHPSEFEFGLIGGFDGNDRLKDFHYDYEPWVSEWDSFDFDYQLNEIGGSSNV